MNKQPSSRSGEKSPVALLGLGPMGQAMTRTLLAAGHPVTVWNRTSSRAAGVVADGAVLAADAVDAVEAAELVILSLTDYPAMYDVLEGAAGALSGRTLVNLSSDSPDRTRAAATWAEDHGAGFLAGGVMVPAPMVGSPDAYVYYSGADRLMRRHQETLGVIGKPRYLGDDPGLAQLMYQAQLTVFLTTLSGLMQATAMLGSAGMKAAETLPELLGTVDTTSVIFRAGEEQPGLALDAGEHPGELSSITMMGATADHIVTTAAGLGLDLALPRAVQAHYRRAIEDGHGGDNWTRIIDGIRSPR